ncbi:MAG: hypothetical protein POH28_07260 [Acidocella sp.]|nr:hypothetical protein [Acidocella sp.]
MRSIGFLILMGFTVLPMHATAAMTCATAMSLEANNPGIETASINSMIANEWQSMDQATVAHGFAPVASRMLASTTSSRLMSVQCQENPGQMLSTAAAQVYLEARRALDGY